MSHSTILQRCEFYRLYVFPVILDIILGFSHFTKLSVRFYKKEVVSRTILKESKTICTHFKFLSKNFIWNRVGKLWAISVNELILGKVVDFRLSVLLKTSPSHTYFKGFWVIFFIVFLTFSKYLNFRIHPNVWRDKALLNTNYKKYYYLFKIILTFKYY